MVLHRESMFPGGHRERSDAHRLTEADRVVIDRIEKILRENKRIDVGRGQSADVYILDIWDGADTAPWVLKKKADRVGKQQALGITFEQEFAMHDKAYDVIAEAMLKNPEKRFARIPKPLSLLTNEENVWITMEYIDGDTLLERAMRAYIAAYTDENSPWTLEEVQRMKKYELIEHLMGDELVNTLPSGYLERINRGEELDDQHFIGLGLTANKLTNGPSPVLSLSQYEALENTIHALHDAGIHHRDLHASNVIVAKSGEIFVIDFGAAIIRSRNEIAEGAKVYTLKHDEDSNITIRAIVDDEMLKQMRRVARKVA